MMFNIGCGGGAGPGVQLAGHDAGGVVELTADKGETKSVEEKAVAD